MLGATPERIVGRKIVDIMGEKGFATIHPRVERVLRGELVEFEDKVHYVLTGKSRWVHVVYVPERDQRRQVIGWIASIMDVTDLRHADEKLLESEERLAGMINSAMDAIISVNEKQQVVLFNAAAEKVFGCPAAKAIGRPLGRFLPKHVHKTHAQLIQQFDQTGMTARRMGAAKNISALRADGTEFPIEASISQTATREGKLFTIILRDVTERREAERVVRNMNLALESRVIERTRQLTAVNQRLQAIMDRAQIGIIVFNSNGAIALANPAAQEIFGYAAGEMTGLKISRLLPLPARPGRTRALFRSSPQDPAKFTTGLREVQGQRKDRTSIDLDVSLTESIQNGQWQCVAMMNDITERKRLERELIEAGEHERQRLGHELHDSLGQQLHGISYLFSLLRAELKKELPARAREAGRLSRHLNHALELSRGLARGLQPVSPVPEGLMLTLKEMARRTREMFRVDCRFVCRAPVLIHRHNVASHLYRIAQEAVNNAIKHGAATRISVQLAATPLRITLVIRNNGRTFKRSSHKKPGLGLHIMRHRTDAMHGSFQLYPLRSGGMEVICTVPRPTINLLEDPEHES
jgi:PAS domain S-box-containing protein